MPGTAEASDLARRPPMQDGISSAAEAATSLARTRAANVFSQSTARAARPCGFRRLSPAVADLAIDLLEGVADGKTVIVIPFGATLTTGQAGNILNFSRPHLAELPRTAKSRSFRPDCTGVSCMPT